MLQPFIGLFPAIPIQTKDNPADTAFVQSAVIATSQNGHNLTPPDQHQMTLAR